jgi:hypothetical protein
MEPNSLGKSEVNVDCAEELGEYGLCPAEEVGLMDRGSVGTPRPPNLTGTLVKETIGDEGATVLGVRGGALLANVEGSRRCGEYMEWISCSEKPALLSAPDHESGRPASPSSIGSTCRSCYNVRKGY